MRGVVCGRLPCGMENQRVRKIPKGLIYFPVGGIAFDPKNAGEDADNIPVQDRHGLIEGNAGDGTRCVPADTRQGENIVVVTREFSPVLLLNDFGCLLHVAHAGVIAKPFPELVDGRGSCLCQRDYSREFSHPTFPIGQDGFDLGLLEHDFRDPDCVRIAGSAPREIAGVLREPAQQTIYDPIEDPRTHFRTEASARQARRRKRMRRI